MICREWGCYRLYRDDIGSICLSRFELAFLFGAVFISAAIEPRLGMAFELTLPTIADEPGGAVYDVLRVCTALLDMAQELIASCTATVVLIHVWLPN
jgi:hypothetical protein